VNNEPSISGPGFRFRQFALYHQRSTMKVGTDAVLLGSWATAGDPGRILDLGTGCGILALMMAQRTRARIDAIDVHDASVAEASANFIHSPWTDRLRSVLTDVRKWEPGYSYDRIITNPPYFDKQLAAASPARNLARHSLPPEELAFHARRLLNEDGILSLITPWSLRDTFANALTEQGLYLLRSAPVITTPGRAPHLLLQEYTPGVTKTRAESPIILTDSHGRRSPEYAALTRDFYL